MHDRIAYTETRKSGKNYRVSTVLLSGPTYETMVFPGRGWSEVDARRYHTRREALRGHQKLVSEWSD